jgi:hypothetical protein
MDQCANCDETVAMAGRVAQYQALEIAGLRLLAMELHKPICEGHVVLSCEEWIRERTYELSQPISEEWGKQ